MSPDVELCLRMMAYATFAEKTGDMTVGQLREALSVFFTQEVLESAAAQTLDALAPPTRTAQAPGAQEQTPPTLIAQAWAYYGPRGILHFTHCRETAEQNARGYAEPRFFAVEVHAAESQCADGAVQRRQFHAYFNTDSGEPLPSTIRERAGDCYAALVKADAIHRQVPTRLARVVVEWAKPEPATDTTTDT